MKALLTKILLTALSEKALEWVLFWIVGLIVQSTKTDKDNEFYEKFKELYYGETAKESPQKVTS